MEIISEWTAPTVLEIVALIFLFYWLIYLPGKLKLRWMCNNFGAAARSRRILRPRPDEYAIITGASDGIGREYANQLAEKGYNLLLISRTEHKLRQAAEEIKDKYPQAKNIEILAADFTKMDIYDDIQQKIESLDGPIHVLVNNVGIMHNVPEYFARHPNGFHKNLIMANVMSMTMMTEIVLRIMLKQKADPKKPAKGVIINLSSSYGATEWPLFSAYSSTKKYVIFLSKMLAAEYAKDKIIVQTVLPNQVETHMSKDMRTWIVVPVEDYVRCALRAVGSEQTTNAHPKHKFIQGMYDIMAPLLGDWLMMKFKFSALKRLRADYDRKVGPAPPEKVISEEPLVNNNKN